MTNEVIQGDEWATYVALHVSGRRNAGWPTGREPQGHGVGIVVCGQESCLHGEGRQVTSIRKAGRYARCGQPKLY